MEVVHGRSMVLCVVSLILGGGVVNAESLPPKPIQNVASSSMLKRPRAQGRRKTDVFVEMSKKGMGSKSPGPKDGKKFMKSNTLSPIYPTQGIVTPEQLPSPSPSSKPTLAPFIDSVNDEVGMADSEPKLGSETVPPPDIPKDMSEVPPNEGAIGTPAGAPSIEKIKPPTPTILVPADPREGTSDGMGEQPGVSGRNAGGASPTQNLGPSLSPSALLVPTTLADVLINPTPYLDVLGTASPTLFEDRYRWQDVELNGEKSAKAQSETEITLIYVAAALIVATLLGGLVFFCVVSRDEKQEQKKVEIFDDSGGSILSEDSAVLAAMGAQFAQSDDMLPASAAAAMQGARYVSARSIYPFVQASSTASSSSSTGSPRPSSPLPTDLTSTEGGSSKRGKTGKNSKLLGKTGVFMPTDHIYLSQFGRGQENTSVASAGSRSLQQHSLAKSSTPAEGNKGRADQILRVVKIASGNISVEESEDFASDESLEEIVCLDDLSSSTDGNLKTRNVATLVAFVEQGKQPFREGMLGAGPSPFRDTSGSVTGARAFSLGPSRSFESYEDYRDSLLESYRRTSSFEDEYDQARPKKFAPREGNNTMSLSGNHRVSVLRPAFVKK